MTDNNIFSLTLAKKFTGDDEALALQLFAMLQADIMDYHKNIIIRFQQKNFKELTQLVHKLHGSSRCCGTLDLKEKCAELESLLKTSKNIDAKKYVERLLSAIIQVAKYDVSL